MTSKKFIKIIFLTSFAILILPQLTKAAIVPDCAIAGTCQNLNSFFQVFINLAQWGLGILAILATAIIFNSGFVMIFSAGNPDKINSAKSGIMGAVLGIIIILGSWVLINGYIIILTGNPQGTIFGNHWSQLPGSGACSGQPDGSSCLDNQVCIGGLCADMNECDYWSMVENQPNNYDITQYHECLDTNEYVCDPGSERVGFCPGGAEILCCIPYQFP